MRSTRSVSQARAIANGEPNPLEIRLESLVDPDLGALIRDGHVTIETLERYRALIDRAIRLRTSPRFGKSKKQEKAGPMTKPQLRAFWVEVDASPERERVVARDVSAFADLKAGRR